MIKQKQTNVITSSYTTTDADIGYRLICDSASAFEIILHSPIGRNNFELEIDNINTGIVTCNGLTIKQGTHAHVGNTGTAWSVVLGGGAMTLEEINQVLIGENTAHTHPSTGGITPSQIIETFELSSPVFERTGTWFIDSTTAYKGTRSLRSKNISSSGLTSESFTINATEETTLSFYYKISSEENCDFLDCFIDNISVLQVSGEIDWTLFETTLTIGNHIVRFSYSKDSSVDTGTDCAWIDNLSINIQPIFIEGNVPMFGSDNTIRDTKVSFASLNTRYEPLVNADINNPEIMFDDTGDIIMVEV